MNCTGVADAKLHPIECQAFDLSIFSFVYSTFPTAPGVLAFALQYGVDATEMAAGTVLCTIVSAPLMFVTAKMAFIEEIEEGGNTSALQETVQDVAQVFNLASNFGCVIVLVMYLARKRYAHKLDVTVMMLALAMLAYNVATSLCTVGIPGTAVANVRYVVIQYSWLAICAWVIIYAKMVDHLQAEEKAEAEGDGAAAAVEGKEQEPGQGYDRGSAAAGRGRGRGRGSDRLNALSRAAVSFKQLVGWVLPAVLTGIIFGITNSRPDHPWDKLTCLFRGVASSHPEMWVSNFIVVLATFLTLLSTSIKMQRRRLKDSRHQTATHVALEGAGGSSRRHIVGRAGRGCNGDDHCDSDASDASDDALLVPATRNATVAAQSAAAGGGRGGEARQSPGLASNSGSGSGSGSSSGGGGGRSRSSINSTAGWLSDGDVHSVGDDVVPLLPLPLATGSEEERREAANCLKPSDLRHTIFITYELCCMLLALVGPPLAVVHNGTTTRVGPVIELNFVNVALSSAQGVMLFLCFGVEDALWLPVTRAASRGLAWLGKHAHPATKPEGLLRSARRVDEYE